MARQVEIADHLNPPLTTVRQDKAAPWTKDAWGRLAWLYLELGQPANAQAAAEALLAQNPEDDQARQARLARLRRSAWVAAGVAGVLALSGLFVRNGLNSTLADVAPAHRANCA